MRELKFDVYNEDKKVGRIELEGNRILKNECYFDANEEPFPFMVNPFCRMKDGLTVREYLRFCPDDNGVCPRVLRPDKQ